MSHFICISIFPEIYTSFLSTSLIGKAIEKNILTITCINPRDFCIDKHRQVDDTVYGWGVGMLLKAEPIMQAIEYCIAHYTDGQHFRVCMVTPSLQIFDQKIAQTWADDLVPTIFVCGRYEGFDHRILLWGRDTYPDQRWEVSIGKFVLLGGEVASMCMIESTIRLVPWIVWDHTSTVSESYSSPWLDMLEYPQYTKPQTVRGYDVPAILLSGHHHHIDQRKQQNRRRVE